MTLKFNNYSMWVSRKYDADYYEWCVFVDEDPTVINSIKSVEYTLHPTFPNPVRVIEDKSSRFTLCSSGWGTFTIPIRITYEDDSQDFASYQLRLEDDGWPKKAPPEVFVDKET